MKITQKEIKKIIIYDEETGIILRGRDVRGIGKKFDPMTISYNESGYPYISVKRNKYPLAPILTLYVEGFMPKYCRFVDGNVKNWKYSNLLPEPASKIPTYEYVRKAFFYDPDDGRLIRNVAINHFPAGEEAGRTDKLGYKQVKIFGKNFQVHRIIWLYMMGYLPENNIDHIDRNPSNNKWNNLREVSHQCNIRNQSLNSANTTGVKGVCPYKDTGMFFAYIYIDYKNYHLGSFTDFDEAVCHRLAAEQCLEWHGCDKDSTALLYVQQNINPLCW